VGGSLRLGQILVNRGLLEPEQLAAALAEQKSSGARLGMTLVRMGFVDEETLIRALAGQLKLPVVRIRGKRVSPEVLETVGVAVAEKHRCLPLFFKREHGQRVLFVAMEDPADAEALEAIEAVSAEKVRAVLVGPTELEEALLRHYHWASLTGEAAEWSGVPDPSEQPTAAEVPDDPAPRRYEAWARGPAPRVGLDAEDEEGLDPDPAAEAEAPDFAADEDADDLGLDLEERDDGLAPDLEGETAAEPDPLAAALLPEPPSPRSGEPQTEALDPTLILRALSQLLVEKGIIGRDELVHRVGQLAARTARRG
jgi:type IV pilus assembly protein PilB